MSICEEYSVNIQLNSQNIFVDLQIKFCEYKLGHEFVNCCFAMLFLFELSIGESYLFCKYINKQSMQMHNKMYIHKIRCRVRGFL